MIDTIMTEWLRIWFLCLYALGIAVLFIKFILARPREKAVEKRIADWRRFFPLIFLPIDWLVPPLAILSGIGQLSTVWPLIRLLGFALSLYALVILLWVPQVLGRFLIPQAAVFPDHALVTAGPYKFLRHPSFSGALALWLGTALGTLNWPLFALWFLLVAGKTIQARAEEEILYAKFGSVYAAYALRTGRFIPRFRSRG
jgi:protein-S-isoprenylcysteine O-methyltransferase Ste14